MLLNTMLSFHVVVLRLSEGPVVHNNTFSTNAKINSYYLSNTPRLSELHAEPKLLLQP